MIRSFAAFILLIGVGAWQAGATSPARQSGSTAFDTPVDDNRSFSSFSLAERRIPVACSMRSAAQGINSQVPIRV